MNVKLLVYAKLQLMGIANTLWWKVYKVQLLNWCRENFEQFYWQKADACSANFHFSYLLHKYYFRKKCLFLVNLKFENKFLFHAKMLTNPHAECECGRSTQIRLSFICMFVDKYKSNNLIAEYGDTNVISHTYNEFMHSALIIKPQNVQFILINYYVISCVNSFFFLFYNRNDFVESIVVVDKSHIVHFNKAFVQWKVYQFWERASMIFKWYDAHRYNRTHIILSHFNPWIMRNGFEFRWF